MEDEEDDDIYAPDEADSSQVKGAAGNGNNGKDHDLGKGALSANKGEDSGEEFEEDESDSVGRT